MLMKAFKMTPIDATGMMDKQLEKVYGRFNVASHV